MITLVSPAGTRSTLLFPRSRDHLANSFDEWPFLSVHFWGESPVGTWTLEVFFFTKSELNKICTLVILRRCNCACR